MVFFDCSIELSNTVDHKMIAESNLMDSCLYNVSSTCCGDVVNDCCCFKGDSCWLINKLPETEQLIDTSHVFSIVIDELITCPPGEITVRVTKEDHFLAFPIQVGKDFFQLIK